MSLWYMYTESMEYAFVYAANKIDAYNKLIQINKTRCIGDTPDFDKWRIEEFTPDKYDGVIYIN